MSNTCCKTIVSILFGSAILLFMIQGILFLEFHSFQEKECLIKNVTYPQSIEDTANLISCRCGKYCASDAGTCIRIKGNLVNNQLYNPRLFVSSTDINKPEGECTFAEVRCPKGEKIEDRLQSIERARNTALEYITKMESNTAITCYQRDGDPYLYLERNDNSIFFYVSVTLLALTSFCMCGVFCRCCCRDSEHRNQSAFI